MDRGTSAARDGDDRLGERDQSTRSQQPSPDVTVIKTETTLRFALLLTLANGFIDVHTYLVRGGVFATAQTVNLLFLGMGLAQRNWGSAMARVWPMLAFLVGVAVASYIQSGRIDQRVKHPLRWVMALQATVLALIGFLPASDSQLVATVPISFVAALQLGLFREICGLKYVPVSITGNIRRLVEAGYAGLVNRDQAGQAAFRLYATLIITLVVGAATSTLASPAMGECAIWFPAGFIAVTLVLFIVDERKRRES
ncbi:YoaK family protein [Mycobacterium simiae]|uniref:YoaK family protein n=1 Tax=Mycobacterium simiae TaxID=1784 RepID=UPI0021CD482D|nr:YoaK family protein [Mycobacterium simiae]